MKTEFNNGREKVKIVIALILSMSALTIIGTNTISQTGNLPVQLIRLGLTLWLCYALYHGSNVARIITLILMFLAGFLAFTSAFFFMTEHPYAFISLVGGIIYGVCFSLLAFPESVRLFFKGDEVAA